MEKKNIKYYANLILLTSSLALTGCSINVTKDKSPKTIEEAANKELENLAKSSINKMGKPLDKINEEEDILDNPMYKLEVVLNSEEFKSLTDFTITYNKKYAYYSVVGVNEDFSMSCETLDIMNIGYLLSKSNCTNLKLENVQNDEFLEEITRCKSLKSLKISDSSIHFLQALKECKNLEYLKILNCATISDITPLQELTNLQEITIIGTKVSDVTALSKLSELSKVNLKFNEITNPEVLALLPNLEFIDLEYNKINNSKQLKGFKEKGILDEEQISNIIDTSINSGKLFITDDNYQEKSNKLIIAYLASKQQYYVKLQDKNGEKCAFMMIDDLFPLYTLTQEIPNCNSLRFVNCPDELIFKIINNKDRIEKLVIENCDFHSLNDLSNFYNLNYLYVDKCPNLTGDFTVHPYGIYNLENLESVIIKNTNFESLDNLKYIPSIKDLALMNNDIHSYTFLNTLPNLKKVCLTIDNEPIYIGVLTDLIENGTNVSLVSDEIKVTEKGKEYTKKPQ